MQRLDFDGPSWWWPLEQPAPAWRPCPGSPLGAVGAEPPRRLHVWYQQVGIISRTRPAPTGRPSDVKAGWGPQGCMLRGGPCSCSVARTPLAACMQDPGDGHACMLAQAACPGVTAGGRGAIIVCCG